MALGLSGLRLLASRAGGLTVDGLGGDISSTLASDIGRDADEMEVKVAEACADLARTILKPMNAISAKYRHTDKQPTSHGLYVTLLKEKVPEVGMSRAREVFLEVKAEVEERVAKDDKVLRRGGEDGGKIRRQLEMDWEEMQRS